MSFNRIRHCSGYSVWVDYGGDSDPREGCAGLLTRYFDGPFVVDIDARHHDTEINIYSHNLMVLNEDKVDGRSRLLTASEQQLVTARTVAALQALQPLKTISFIAGTDRMPYPIMLNRQPPAQFRLASTHSVIHPSGCIVDFTYTLHYTFESDHWYTHRVVYTEGDRSAEAELITQDWRKYGANGWAVPVATLQGWHSPSGDQPIAASEQALMFQRIREVCRTINKELILV